MVVEPAGLKPAISGRGGIERRVYASRTLAERGGVVTAKQLLPQLEVLGLPFLEL